MSDENNNPKDVEFYAANVNAWFNTRFELDKSLLTLSTAAVGILVTLMTTVIKPDYFAITLCSSALASFLVCIYCVLDIFRCNATHLECVVTGAAEVTTTEAKLVKLDKIAWKSFFIGVALSCLLAVITAIVSTNDKGEKVSQDNTKPSDEITFAHNSVSGVTKLSIGGISKLQPSQGEQHKNPQQPTSTPVVNKPTSSK